MKFFVAVLLLTGILFQNCLAAVYTEDNYRDFVRKCSKILGTSVEVMEQLKTMKGSVISDDREVHCLVRCVGIVSEFYDDETGTNWDLVAQQVDGKEGIEEHRLATTKCVQALPQDDLQSDVCRRSYRIFRCYVESDK